MQQQTESCWKKAKTKLNLQDINIEENQSKLLGQDRKKEKSFKEKNLNDIYMERNKR